jgi:hypothetical protein
MEMAYKVIELFYNAKNYDQIAWKEIDQGRSVAIRVTGWRKKLIYDLVSLYNKYEVSRAKGVNDRGVLFKISWRAIITGPFFGVCNHARLKGMSIVVQDKDSTLLVKFEK